MVRKVVVPSQSRRKYPITPPRRKSKIAVDKGWGEPCRCAEGDNWRFPGSTQRKCPKCGGIVMREHE